MAGKWRKRTVGRFAFLVFLMPENYQATPIAPSGGRAESLWRGLSDMDVARAAMGQGRPFAAGPRNNDGAREPQRSWGRMPGLDLLVSFGAMPKETRSTERNRTYEQHDNAGKPQRVAFSKKASIRKACGRSSPRNLEAKASPTISVDVCACLKLPSALFRFLQVASVALA